MTHDMRRSDRALGIEEARKILADGDWGVLSIVDGDGKPYGMPMNYVVIDGSPCFHRSASDGHALEGLRDGSPATFAVVRMDDRTSGCSAIVFGRIARDGSAQDEVLERFVERFVPSCAWQEAKRGIPARKGLVDFFRIEVEHLSAKRVERPAGQE